MIFHLAVLALHLSSLLVGFMILYSARHAAQILRKWDLKSGSEYQLSLERKTYLVSTFLGYAFGFQLASLFLLVYTADALHTLFVGAMCAAGSFFVNRFGYPALILKMVNFLLGGLWLILNHADNRAFDYPLIKKKYLLLLFISPLIIAEIILQWSYFLHLKPDVITSCCGSLFSTTTESVASEIASLPHLRMKILFYVWTAFTLSAGLSFSFKNKGGYAFGCLNGILFLIALASILSFISVYVYELPTHHCPFCILQKEYDYHGYPLYIALFGSTLTGIGTGLLMPFRKIESLKEVIPVLQRKLAFSSLAMNLLFTGMVTYNVIFSGLILQ